jgi:hypothetical protein
MKKVKFITAIYSDLYGSDFGGRPSRNAHYRWSLLSLLKMTDADFICYTSDREIESLKKFFYVDNSISETKLRLITFDLNNHYFLDLFKKYKNFELAKKSDRCVEIQHMKFIWFMNEDMSYDYYFWIDAGLSHCGLIPEKYLSSNGHMVRKYYESSLFNNKFLNNLVGKTEDKFTIIGKENVRNHWSSTVNQTHFKNYDRSIHVIGGLFGGKKELWSNIVELFKNYVTQVCENDKKVYHEEDIMTLMFRNHPELFHNYYFETWWHENEKISGLNMEEHLTKNKSFYKILEELN